MCMLFVNNNTDAKDDEYALTIMSIRDESYERPTRSCQTWSSNPAIFGGMDMTDGLEGGTWLALNRDTNKLGVILRALRPIDRVSTSKYTRGFLVPRFMNSCLSGADYLDTLVDDCADYPAYNLVTFDLNQPKNGENNVVSYFSNAEKSTMPTIDDELQVLAFANNLPHKLWQKTEVGRDFFRDITQRYRKTNQKMDLASKLFTFASDDTKYYPDPVLAADGSGYEPEYLQGISSINCKIPFANFGTRTQTIILVDKVGNVEWIERNLTEDNLNVRGNKYAEWPLKKFRLRLNTSLAYNHSYLRAHL